MAPSEWTSILIVPSPGPGLTEKWVPGVIQGVTPLASDPSMKVARNET